MNRKELETMADAYSAQCSDTDKEACIEKQAYIAGFLAGRDAASECVFNTSSEYWEIKALGEDTD